MKLLYEAKCLYGQVRFYPKNSDAITICELMKVKVMLSPHIRKCIKHGWNVEFINNPLPLYLAGELKEPVRDQPK
jgi:hypothetical protein